MIPFGQYPLLCEEIPRSGNLPVLFGYTLLFPRLPLQIQHHATLESLWVNLGAAARGTALRVQPFIYTFTLGTDLGSVW